MVVVMSDKMEKIYDLEERTLIFAKRVRNFCQQVPKNSLNAEYIPQLIRSSSSPGANYIEANEKLGEKDFGMKIKICLKESKESHYWLQLMVIDNSSELEKERMVLGQEAKELVLIFSSILNKRPPR